MSSSDASHSSASIPTSDHDVDLLLSEFSSPNEVSQDTTSSAPSAVEESRSILPAARKNKLGSFHAVAEVAAEPSSAPNQKLIDTAKDLLEQAGTSIEELAGVKPGLKKQSGFKSGKGKFSRSFDDLDEEGRTSPSLKKSSESTPLPTPVSALDQVLATTQDHAQSGGDTSAGAPAPSSGMPDSEITSRKRYKVQRGFFHYLGLTCTLGAMAAGVWLTYSYLSKLFLHEDAPVQAEIVSDKVLEEERLASLKALQPLAEGSLGVKEARKTLNDYFSASSPQLAFSFISKAEEITETFLKYWTETENFSDDQLTLVEAFTLPNKTEWVHFSYDFGKGTQSIYLQNDADGNFKLDWQALTQIEDLNLVDLNKEVKTVPHHIRAWVTPDSSYPVGYNAQYWYGLKAYDLSGESINCYIPQNTGNQRKLSLAMRNSASRHQLGEGSGVFVKMLVHKPSIGAEYVQVLDIEATSWNEEIDALREE